MRVVTAFKCLVISVHVQPEQIKSHGKERGFQPGGAACRSHQLMLAIVSTLVMQDASVIHVNSVTNVDPYLGEG